MSWTYDWMFGFISLALEVQIVPYLELATFVRRSQVDEEVKLSPTFFLDLEWRFIES